MSPARGGYEPPTPTFPYKIRRRLNALSRPRRSCEIKPMPNVTQFGVRVSALRARATDRIVETGYPYLRRLILTKRLHAKVFTPDRLERLETTIRIVNASYYTKLAGCYIAFDQIEKNKADMRKKKGWGDHDWKRHMDYINLIASPRKTLAPPPIQRGPRKPLSELQERLRILTQVPEIKLYRRQSQEVWYKDPKYISPNALQYKITDKIKKLAEPRVYPAIDAGDW